MSSIVSTIPPDLLTVGLVLCSALLHASWNALTKASGDQLANVAIVTLTCGLLGAVAIPFVGRPTGMTWVWLLASMAMHFAYHLALVRMYRLGDLSQVYPIARGLAPLGVATLAAIWGGESLAPFQMLGLGLSSVAILVLSGVFPRSVSETAADGAVPAALLVSLLIGTYTYIDGSGVRSGASPRIFIAWSFLMNAIPIGILLPVLRGRQTAAAIRSAGWRAVGGGLMGAVGYVIVLWAMSRTTMASVASLRESSVLFAAILGTQLLGEPFGRRRIGASAVLVIGLILVQVAKA